MFKPANNLKPFTKWVGGKRQLLPKLSKFIPHNFNKYYEPFVGGGAMLFSLAPSNASINDLNPELINTYKIIKNNPSQLLKLLSIHAKNNCKTYYLKIRNWDRNGILNKKNNVERAARFLYMLRVDFNGMYRVNRKGEFNVPFGRYKHPKIVNRNLILADSHYLNKYNIKCTNMDFAKSLKDVNKNDFVYLDPPYIPLNVTSNFTSYTSNGFNLKDQKRLRNTYFTLSNKGAYVMLSNSYTSLTKKLYKSAYIYPVKARRTINSNAMKRGKIKELIITNYKVNNIE